MFQADYVGAVVMPGGASQPRKQLDAWQEWAKQRGARGLAYVLVQEDGTLAGPVAKNLSETELAGLAAHVGAEPGDCVFFAAGATKASRALLGAARLEIGRRCGLVDESAWSFLWVVDAPLFEPAADAVAAGDVAVGAGAWTAVHHAFTSPKAEFLDTFDTDPGPALAYAYDMVCNGNEIGGGSIRIHRRDVQERVFRVMGLSAEDAQEKFGFLLDAFAFGAPPHGGIAFGWDRIVMLLGGFESIRDVIAFPKSGGGYDPLTDAPAPITPEQRKEAGIDSRPPASEPEPDAVRSAVEEGEQRRVELLGVRDVDAVRPARDDVQLAARHLLVGALPGLLQGDDAVGVAVDDEGRHGDVREVVGEVGRSTSGCTRARRGHRPAARGRRASCRCSSVTLSSPSALKKLRVKPSRKPGGSASSSACMPLHRVVVEGAVGVVVVELQAGRDGGREDRAAHPLRAVRAEVAGDLAATHREARRGWRRAGRGRSAPRRGHR